MSENSVNQQDFAMTGVNDLRRAFLDYFGERDHAVRASSALVPDKDPTLLFTNAGMVPFKNIFTGAETPPSPPRAASSQKCVRAGGKHNDLDNVGYTARHHTFFEMLGNFSFGDYFKEEAIGYAWDLVTGTLGLPKDKLTVTVYADDTEAAALWRKIAGLPDSRIIPIASSDNFWSMGDTGPCGPCSEIFYDHGPDIWGGPPGSADQDGDRFIEIWNLVFMQFEQLSTGERLALPKPSIDTGMGLERIAAVLQGVHNNYEIDLFASLIAAEQDVLSTRATDANIASFRVIADHLRASSFLIADGVTPSNEGRGYVLRRIMRRAMRHAHILGAREPVMFKMVPALVAEMGQAYPELGRAEPVIVSQLEEEEARFQRTLGRGLTLLEEASTGLEAGDRLPGETAFKLYDTFGFPLDLTQDILRAREITVDADGFNSAMERQREEARANWQGSGDAGEGAIWFPIATRLGSTDFTGYKETTAESTLAAIVAEGAERTDLTAGNSAELIFPQTPFYAESGGQAGDKGVIAFANGARFEVADVKKRAGTLHAHIGTLVSGQIRPGDTAQLDIDTVRRAAIRSNHSATHLLHAALRQVLGPHVSQKGSLVEADRLRFDFSHPKPLSEAEIDAIEAHVNAVIRQNAETSTREMAPEEAIAAGALALFGEKYGERVRVLAMGEALEGEGAYSVELCGGTHVTRTGDIALLTVLSEGGVSSGVRRIEATTGAAALAHLKAQAGIARTIADVLKAPLADAPLRVAQLSTERRQLEAALNDAKRRLAMADESGTATGPAMEDVGGVKFLGKTVQGVPAKELRNLVDEGKQSLGSGVVAFVAVNEGKAAVAVGVSDDLTARFSAVELVRVAAEALGGKGGGGRPDMAQAGGPDGDNAPAALAAVKAALLV